MVHYCSSGIRKKLHRMIGVVTEYQPVIEWLGEQRGDNMKIGFIGAGKAGCSLGKYFASRSSQADVRITGYYSIISEETRWVAQFTASDCFQTAEEVIAASDTIVISTPDGAVKKVWEALNKENVKGRIFCHLSGSLSSDVFSGIEELGGYPISIHPLFAFSDRESVYQQLNQVSFTLEGHPYAVAQWKDTLSALGNASLVIDKAVKPKYHAAASILSNHVIAVLGAGYRLLEECGFSGEEARSFTSVLVRDNVEHVIREGCVKALTGPIERADEDSVKKHLSVLNTGQREIYQACGRQLLAMAREKNPDRVYGNIEELFFTGGYYEKYSVNI